MGGEKNRPENLMPVGVQKCEDFCASNDMLPDGAFFAMAKDQGITIADWSIYANWLELQKLNKETLHVTKA